MSRRETTNLGSLLNGINHQEDGTSQQSRMVAALDPQAVPIDGRSDEDLITFVQKLTKYLIFSQPDYASDDETPGSTVMHWDALATPIPSSGLTLSPEDIVSYIDGPEHFSGEAARWLGRPHFALLLTCVALLRHVRDQQNAITRRHLDHFYRGQLGMAPLAALPDQVAVVFRPARGVRELLLPAGTRLNAGKDSRNRDRIYVSDNDLLIRPTRVRELRTVFIDRKITTLNSLRGVARTPGNQESWFEQALRLALGVPEPGDALPSWDLPNIPTKASPAEILASWKDRLNVCETRLHLLPQELRELMRLLHRRTDAGSDREWEVINRSLGFATDPAEPRNFMANLQARVGPLDFDRDGLSQVRSIDDLYRYRDDPAVRLYIETELSELGSSSRSSYANFTDLMAIKLRIDGDWRQIRRLLEAGGRKARPNDLSWRLNIADPMDFQAMLEASFSIAPSNWPSGQQGVKELESYYSELRQMEMHLFMPVERIQILVGAAESILNSTVLPNLLWDRLITLLADAYRERFHARGREKLDELRQILQASGLDGPKVLDSLIIQVLNDLDSLFSSSASSRNWKSIRAELLPTLSAGEITVLDVFRQQLQEPGVVPRRFDWSDVLVVLETLQRRIGGVKDPEPMKREWRNIEAAVDPRAKRLESGRWPTFGLRSPQRRNLEPEPLIGFALLTPRLNLTEGKRTLVITLGFALEVFDRDRLLKRLGLEGRGPTTTFTDLCNVNLTVRVSGARGWIPLDIDLAELPEPDREDYWSLTGLPKPSTVPALPAMRLVLVAGPSVEAFVPASGHDSPMLQILLKPRWDDSAGEWTTTGAFEPLLLEAAHLAVTVQGLRHLILQQDDRKLDGNKTFEPFGPQPTVGSRLYISHPEIISHRLDRIFFQLDWTGLSKGLGSVYSNYKLKHDGSATNAQDFKVRIDLIDRQESVVLGLPPQSGMLPVSGAGVSVSLFDPDTTAAAAPSVAASNRTIEVLPLENDHQDLADFSPGEDLRQDLRVWCWTLTPIDFGHGLYPALAALKAQELAIALATRTPASPNAESYRVDPPYTPILNALSIDYSTSLEFEPEKQDSDSQLLYVHPFGVSRMPVTNVAGKLRTLMPAYGEAGELYIGLEDADLPQHLSILVQLAEGTSDPDLEPGRLLWQILDGDQWRDLITLRDGTGGFLHSGIVVLDLPQVAPSRCLPRGLQWLRVTIDRNPTSVCDCIALEAQALMATFVDDGHDQDVSFAPLQPGSIKALMNPDARIASIEQPYSSFGGRPAEMPTQLDRRVSESLRHKGRALAAWDYEHLVLEEFGSRIHKVKAITGVGDGLVDVIVIPDLRGAMPADSLAPKASANLLEAIRLFLHVRSATTATVRVQNAIFLPVKIRLGVRFREDQEERFSQQRLREDLVRFLSPWAYDEVAEIRIGGAIYATSIVDFVDRLNYVDYVATIRLSLLDRSETIIQSEEGLAASIKAPGPEVVLVSSRFHTIDIISENDYSVQSLTGIGYMQIGFDFIVAPSPT